MQAPQKIQKKAKKLFDYKSDSGLDQEYISGTIDVLNKLRDQEVK